MSEILEEIKEIKKEIREIRHKLDILMEERETSGMVSISERSLFSSLSKEPEIYRVSDCRVVYR